MVLSNASSRARNMTQTGNQPQAADFGDIFPSVGFGAYGSRNRRQRGIGNITLWSTTKQRANHGRNTGRNVTASRSGSWNVKGTSANTILINEVNDAQGVLNAATTAHTNATTALTTATNALYSDSPTNTTPGGIAVISALNTAINTLSGNLAGFATTIDNSTLTDDEKNAAKTERDSIASITQTQIPSGTYDPTDSSATPNISDIKALVESLSTAVSRMDTLVATYTALTSPVVSGVTDAIDNGNAEITRVATYDAAVITKANTAAAQAAANTALAAAQAAVY
jgi:hypothetical protein